MIIVAWGKSASADPPQVWDRYREDRPKAIFNVLTLDEYGLRPKRRMGWSPCGDATGYDEKRPSANLKTSPWQNLF
jgi:hypothetical protein